MLDIYCLAHHVGGYNIQLCDKRAAIMNLPALKLKDKASSQDLEQYVQCKQQHDAELMEIYSENLGKMLFALE